MYKVYGLRTHSIMVTAARTVRTSKEECFHSVQATLANISVLFMLLQPSSHDGLYYVSLDE